MKVKVENLEKNVVQLEITIEAEEFEKGMQKAFVKNAKKFNIPGFRKGKAPRKIVERHYGEGVLYDEAINVIYPDAYDKAIKEQDISPVDLPQIDIKQIGSGQEFVFVAKVIVMPEVELGNYKGIQAEIEEVSVTDEDVENELKKTVEKNARFISVEDRPVQDGDTTIIDFEGFIDGVPFEGGKAENYNLVIGSNSFIEGFESSLIGVELNKEIDVNVKFPDDYGKEELKGKPALFKVKVNEIKAKELPEVDDEFAQDVSEFDTLNEYKSDLKLKLVSKADEDAKNKRENGIVDEVVENASVDIPDVMIQKRVDSIMQNYSLSLRYQGLDINDYMRSIGMDADKFKEQFRGRAESEIKTQLVLDKISKEENIVPNEQELEEEIERTAKARRQSVEDFKKYIEDDDINYMKDTLRMKKTIDFLVENSVEVVANTTENEVKDNVDSLAKDAIDVTDSVVE